MALVLDSGEYLSAGGFDPGIATEFTVGAYFKAGDTTGWKAIVEMLLTGEVTITHILLAANGANYDHWHYPQSGAVRLDIAGSVSTSAWQLVLMNYKQSTAESQAYLGNTNTKTISADYGSFRDLIDRIRIGMTDYSSIGSATNNGKIAHVSVWDKQLTPTEVTDLATGGAGGIGKNPQDVASANLKFYAPLTSDATVTVGGVSLTATGSVSYDADNPSVAAAGGGGNAAPTFPGPNIGNQTGTVGTPISFSVASKFYDTDALTFTAIGSWPPGVTVSSAGLINGTPTVDGVYSTLSVRATDTAAQPIDSDVFSFTILPAPHLVTASNSQQVNSASSGAVTIPSGSIVIPEFRDWNTGGNLLAGETGVTVWISEDVSGELVVKLTGQTSHATTAVCTVSHALIASVTDYHVRVKLANGAQASWTLTSS